MGRLVAAGGRSGPPDAIGPWRGWRLGALPASTGSRCGTGPGPGEAGALAPGEPIGPLHPRAPAVARRAGREDGRGLEANHDLSTSTACTPAIDPPTPGRGPSLPRTLGRVLPGDAAESTVDQTIRVGCPGGLDRYPQAAFSAGRRLERTTWPTARTSRCSCTSIHGCRAVLESWSGRGCGPSPSARRLLHRRGTDDPRAALRFAGPSGHPSESRSLK